MGPITVRTALSQSVNIAAVRTILKVGIENVVDTAHKLGITSLPHTNRYGPTRVSPAPYASLITAIPAKSCIQWSGLTISRTAAAKTGTSENFKDALVVGYTPDPLVGVWMGNSDSH